MKCHIINTVALIFLTGHSIVSAQSDEFFPGDPNYSLTLSFHKTDTVLVVFPDSFTMKDHNKSIIENYVFWDQYQKKPAYIYKKESELIDCDLNRKIQLYGPFYSFTNPSFFDMPIEKIPNGFRFNNQDYIGQDEAFFYINDEATILYTCPNSKQATFQYANYAAGYYQLYAFQNDDLIITGIASDKDSSFSINNIQQLRENYFKTISTKYFDFHISKKILSDSILNVLKTEPDNYFETLCTHLQVDSILDIRVQNYIYTCREDLQQFIGIPPAMKTWGKSVGSINHISSFDLSVFKHELTHSIIRCKIGEQPNNFFNEGFAVFAGYFDDIKAFTHDLELARINVNKLNSDFIFRSGNNFFNTMDNYALAGIFTYFLIEKAELDAFKTAFAQKDMELYFDQNNLSIDSLICDFEQWLIGQ